MGWQDILATLATFALALGWLRLMDALAHRGLIEQRLSRKLIHIGTGPLFVLCWLLYSDEPQARWLAALVPLAITVQFALVGLGVIEDPAAVQAMSRTGDRREILRGPLYYGLVFVAVTLLFWRDSPVGMLALMLMCGGDGLADVVGRRWGRARLPWSRDKSWAGSAAMAAGSFVFALATVWLFNALGHFTPALEPGGTLAALALIALVATAVETLPARDVDNVTVTLAAIATAWLLIGPLGWWAAPFRL
jgi:phytol kinase